MDEYLQPLHFIMAVWASVIVARSGLQSRLQLAAYFVLTWGLPILGPILASLIAVLRTRSNSTFEQRANDAKVEAISSLSQSPGNN